ncbi:hypothetical protein DSECCO2_213420 [anaerobic digester metagenome]
MKEFSDGDPLFGVMVNAIANLWPNGTAPLSGCTPTGSGAARQVTVAAGSVVINGTVRSVSQQTKTLDAATFDRYDLISVNTSGTVVVTKGTEERRVPALPANSVPIAICLIETGQTTLPADRIYDTRMDALRLSALNINADKNWNGKNITNLGKISPISWLIILGGDPLLITKTHDSSTTVTFAQVEAGHGNVKVIVKGAYVHAYGTRIFKILKNGIEIWSASQSSSYGGEYDFFAAYTATAFEDLAVESGDVLTISRTGGAGAVTVEIYATPLVAPYGIAT